MNCPNCGAWVARKTRLAVGGDALVSPDAWGNVYIGGFRCSACRTLVLSH